MITHRKYRPVLFIIIMMISFLFLTQRTYSFFDNMLNEREETIPIGEWYRLTDDVTPTNISFYINITYPNNTNVQNYLKYLMFTTNEQAMDPIFSNYTFSEITSAIDIIVENVNNFLTFNANGLPEYKTNINPTIYSGMTMNPGETIYIRQYILVANYQNTRLVNNQSITQFLDLSVRGYANTNISDYSVDFVIDTRNLPTFNYRNQYQRVVNNTATQFLNRIFTNNSIANTQMATTVSYESEIRNTTKYTQAYGRPSFNGIWNRMPSTSKLYLTAPNSFGATGQATNTGVYVHFATDGTPLQLVCGYHNFASLPKLIPVVLVLTRGTGGTTIPGNHAPTIEVRYNIT